MKVPETPLCTPAVLSEERAQWCEVQVSSIIAIMLAQNDRF